MGDSGTNSTTREKKLKEEISRLRKKSKKNVMKIKSLQNKIRLILRKKGIEKSNSENDQGLQRQIILSDNESLDLESSPPSPDTSYIEKINFDSESDVKIKSEPSEHLDEMTELSATRTDISDFRFDEVKLEEDPLQLIKIRRLQSKVMKL